MRRLFIFIFGLAVVNPSDAEEKGSSQKAAEAYDLSYYNTWMLAAASVPPRKSHPLDTVSTPAQLAAARAELRRRPGSVEYMISQLEKPDSKSPAPTAYFAALGRVVETTPEQKRRIMRVIRANWAEYQAVAAGRAERTKKDYGLLGAAEFLGANPGPESERLLLEMLAADVDYLYIPAILAMNPY